jgi:hypothetical protein
MIQTIQEKIKQRRRQMLVHSYLYYEKDVNIVSDAQWSKWAMELVELQKKYPKESAEVEEWSQFRNWDGNSGAGLKFSENIKSVAERLLYYYEHPSKYKKDDVAVKKKRRGTSSLF